MAGTHFPDYYEILQLSPRADQETIGRVFRHLAKRFHPDNTESGSPERFRELLDAFQILCDPEQRARYDAQYEGVREARWHVFDQESAVSDVVADRRIRAALLSILYTARRNDADHPGIGTVDLERLLGCPQEHMKFHLWYLKENGWIQRLENGMLAITVTGVDRVLELGEPQRDSLQLLEAGGGSGHAA